MLRNITQEGKDLINALYESKEYPEYFRHFEDFMNKEDVETFMATAGTVLEITDDNKVIGIATIAIANKTRICYPSVLIEKANQSRGLARTTLMELADLTFSKGCLRMVCNCSKDDTRAMDLLKKGGFLPEAKLRSNCYYSGKFHDEVRWVLPREQYMKLYKIGR